MSDFHGIGNICRKQSMAALIICAGGILINLIIYTDRMESDLRNIQIEKTISAWRKGCEPILPLPGIRARKDCPGRIISRRQRPLSEALPAIRVYD